MAFCICESAPDGAEDKRMTYTMREVTKRAGVSPAIQLGKGCFRFWLTSGVSTGYMSSMQPQFFVQMI